VAVVEALHQRVTGIGQQRVQAIEVVRRHHQVILQICSQHQRRGRLSGLRWLNLGCCVFHLLSARSDNARRRRYPAMGATGIARAVSEASVGFESFSARSANT
jgi:hypothetical protein